MIEKPAMSLVVGVSLTGMVDDEGKPSISAAYTRLASEPNAIRGTDVVDGHGNIDLEELDFDPHGYVLNTAVTFSLSGMIADTAGTEVQFGFPGDPAQAVTIEPEREIPSQLTPRSGSDPKQVIIDSENADGATYTYCLGILLGLPAPGGTIVRLDPSFHNRPL
jgi:hypothetical protein